MSFLSFVWSVWKVLHKKLDSVYIRSNYSVPSTKYVTLLEDGFTFYFKSNLNCAQ